MHPLAVNVLSGSSLISSFGTVGLIAIVFAETGLLIGIFFPGDSLLFLAGAFCATKAGSSDPHLSLGPVLVGVAVAAVVGAQVGYLIGRATGERLLDRPGSRLVKPRVVERTREVMERYGEGKAILLARFIPGVRTVMNPLMGILRVPARTFALWNVVGGVVWAVGVTLLGYALGSSISIDKYILPITFLIILASLVPIVLEVRKQRRTAASGRVR